jgi:uncharacterized membrane protein HdeD (DUF308 family)
MSADAAPGAHDDRPAARLSSHPIADALGRAWWAVMLRGVVAVAFGIVVLAWPGLAFATLLALFGVYCLVDGFLGIWAAVTGHATHENRWLYLLWALVSIGAGLAALLVPGITALALLFYIGAWAVASGVLQIVAAVQLRREIDGEWLLLLSGIVTVVFGMLLFARPGAGAMAMLALLGAFAIVSGIALIFLGIRARHFARNALAATHEGHARA